MSKFFTKNGWLSVYAMNCGYIHQSENANYTVTFRENNPELNTYDIILFHAFEGRKEWEVVEGIVAARKLYEKFCWLYAGKLATRERKSYEPIDVPAVVFA